MKTKIRKDQLTKEEMEVFKNKNCKLLSSKQLAELLDVTEGAIRKQRSKDRSLFPYAKLGGSLAVALITVLYGLIFKYMVIAPWLGCRSK